jgi:hypothetical protein
MLHPGGALQIPFSVEHSSPIAQLAVDAHGTTALAPPAPALPPRPAVLPLEPLAPPEPLTPPLAPPPPVGSSGHDTLQWLPIGPATHSTMVRPTRQAGTGGGGPQSFPPVPALPIVPPDALVPASPPRPAAPPPVPPFPSGTRGSTEHAAEPVIASTTASHSFGDRMRPRAEH